MRAAHLSEDLLAQGLRGNRIDGRKLRRACIDAAEAIVEVCPTDRRGTEAVLLIDRALSKAMEMLRDRRRSVSGTAKPRH